MSSAQSAASYRRNQAPGDSLPTREEEERLTAYARKHGLANACRVLLNSTEFTFVD